MGGFDPEANSGERQVALEARYARIRDDLDQEGFIDADVVMEYLFRRDCLCAGHPRLQEDDALLAEVSSLDDIGARASRRARGKGPWRRWIGRANDEARLAGRDVLQAAVDRFVGIAPGMQFYNAQV